MKSYSDNTVSKADLAHVDAKHVVSHRNVVTFLYVAAIAQVLFDIVVAVQLVDIAHLFK